MKVGILTFHEGLNHGAFLQAFCTTQTVKLLGHDPVIINYKNRAHWLREDVRPWLAYRRPIRFTDRWQKQRAFKRDHKLLPLTPYTRDPDEVKKWHFDAVIVGSDVVWDTHIFGYDSLYFGDLNADRRIAYAASCGSEDYSRDADPKVRAGLLNFDAISVRDLNTAKLVQAVTGKPPSKVLDPVFLPASLDIYTTDAPLVTGPFVLVYGGRFSAEDGRLIKKYAVRKKMKIISVGYRNVWADQNIMSAGPMAVLNYFKHAAFIFSGTFHGTVFAVRFNKEFAVILNKAIHNKATSLLDVAGCPERSGNTVESIISVLDHSVDYARVDQRLSVARESSLKFLKSALSN